ncbi:hypothetical protein K440DRAFT_620389 [Wilcoxina mikolae CBS 423.85]|nr:hypothetical protein K440DRAFT_620389 [Wilcoxina mikolae CBS 423.85]
MAPPKKTPVRSKSTVSKKRQTTLNFAPLSSPTARPSSRISSSRYVPLPDNSSAKSTPTSTPRKNTTMEVVILTPRKQGNTRIAPILVDETSEDEEPIQNSRTAPILVDDNTEDEEPIQSSGKRRRPSRPVVLDDDENESDAIPVIQLLQRNREASKEVTFASAVDGEGAIAEDSESDATPRARRKRQKSLGEEDDDGDDDDDIISPATKRRRSSTLIAMVGGKSREQTKEQSHSLEDEDEAPSSTHVEPPESEVDPEIRPAHGGESDTDDLEILPPTTATAKDESGMGSDYELALETPTMKSRTRYAGSSNKKNTSRQKTLAMMRAERERRNNGGMSSPLPNNNNSDAEDEEEDEDDDDNEESTSHLYEDLNADLPDFVVEDGEDDLLGAPDDVEMPLEFTSASHASNREQFKVYVEYLIHDVLFPGLVTRDARVINAIHRLDTYVSGLNDSVIKSGAWRPAFTRAMKARPKLVTSDCFPIDHCDACNRNKQHCTSKVQFTGKRYDRDTLDDLSSDEDEETQDSNGEALEPEDTLFALGRHCFLRTKSAHVLSHWKKELKDWVSYALVRGGYIDEDGDIADDGVTNMNDQEKGEWVCDVCNVLSDNTDELYYDFDMTIKTARESMRPKNFRSNATRAYF